MKTYKKSIIDPKTGLEYKTGKVVDNYKQTVLYSTYAGGFDWYFVTFEPNKKSLRILIPRQKV